MAVTWNPWHGCTRVSAGCQHCYMFAIDEKHGKDPTRVVPTADFLLPLQQNRQKQWKIPKGETVYTCFSSDFFHPDADSMRQEAWEMMRRRSDLNFFLTTKRIERFEDCMPADWGDGYRNVTIACTVENQREADHRLPIYVQLPIRHKQLVCEPLLEFIDFRNHLHEELFEQVIVGGESGPEARILDYRWVLSVRQQCIDSQTPFHFKQTGAKLLYNGRIYNVERAKQMEQAKRANLDWKPE